MDRRVSKIAAVGGLAVGLIGLAGAVVPAHAATTRHIAPSSLPGIGRLIPATTHGVLPTRGDTVDSLNWSGYAVGQPPGAPPVTAVSSSFVVPTAYLLPPGFAATWTGIGGYQSQDLIQAGVGENSLFTNPITGPQYYAWYEILPAAETPITGCSGDANCTVSPGDHVSVTITNAGGSRWTVSMADGTRWTYSRTVNYNSSGSSAEWVLEAPTVGLQTLLAEVGTARFGTNTYTAGGITRTIAAGNANRVVLSPGLVNEATPSNLAPDGQSFNVCAYAQSCPAP